MVLLDKQIYLYSNRVNKKFVTIDSQNKGILKITHKYSCFCAVDTKNSQRKRLLSQSHCTNRNKYLYKKKECIFFNIGGIFVLVIIINSYSIIYFIQGKPLFHFLKLKISIYTR